MNAAPPGSVAHTVRRPLPTAVRFVLQNFNKGSFLALHCAIVLALFVPVTWTAVGLCVGCYYLRIFGIGAGYHRYFSHRSFRTSRLFQFVLACLGCSAIQKGPLWWAAKHRHHHKHSDQEDDPHSPVRHGLWWSHIGWVLSTENDDLDPNEIPDFARYWELRLLERLHWVPGAVLAGLCLWIGGWSGVVWGFVVSTVLVYHATFLVNSVCHVLGKRRYRTTDASRNNWWVALLTMGEGWHNNHHHYMSSVRQGFRWWEIDCTYYVLRLLSLPRVVWALREVPQAKLAAC